jgi:hypothetical protein
VPEVGVAQTNRAEVAEPVQTWHLVLCPVCQSDRLRRLPRGGILRQYIMPLFGLYPWRCCRCGVTSMLKKRHQRRRHPRRALPEMESPQHEVRVKSA